LKSFHFYSKANEQNIMQVKSKSILKFSLVKIEIEILTLYVTVWALSDLKRIFTYLGFTAMRRL
jgi:hypothetical protein